MFQVACPISHYPSSTQTIDLLHKKKGKQGCTAPPVPCSQVPSTVTFCFLTKSDKLNIISSTFERKLSEKNYSAYMYVAPSHELAAPAT